MFTADAGPQDAVTVPVTPDATTESNEMMYLVVAGVDGGENHRERGVGTILNDDPGTGVGLVTSDAYDGRGRQWAPGTWSCRSR